MFVKLLNIIYYLLIHIVLNVFNIFHCNIALSLSFFSNTRAYTYIFTESQKRRSGFKRQMFKIKY